MQSILQNARERHAPLMEFRGVTRAFNTDKPALDDVTLSMGANEVVALLGRNGAGKSTLIQLALGTMRPHAGSVRLFGLSPADEPVAVRRRIGYVGESQILPTTASIWDLISLHRRLYPTWDKELEYALCARFGIRDKDAKIGRLSKGQAQQVALLCAVSHRPELMLLDEPAGGLDPAARREFLETSIQLLNGEGTSILFSSHHMGDVERLGGRVVLLDEGKILADTDLDTLREGYCLALIPSDEQADGDRLKALPGCMRARLVYGDWRAVFRGDPDDVGALIRRELRVSQVRCVTVPLEELFVEWVGGKQAVAA